MRAAVTCKHFRHMQTTHLLESSWVELVLTITIVFTSFQSIIGAHDGVTALNDGVRQAREITPSLFPSSNGINKGALARQRSYKNAGSFRSFPSARKPYSGLRAVP